jgi:hypothetical protein
MNVARASFIMFTFLIVFSGCLLIAIVVSPLLSVAHVEPRASHQTEQMRLMVI